MPRGKKNAVKATPAPTKPEPKTAKAKLDPSSVEGILESQAGLLYRGRNTPHLVPEVLPTGLYEFDRCVTSIGGLPRGRIVEVAGHAAAGKTTFSLRAIAEAQRRGLNAAFIDAEHTLDIDWAERQGVNVDDLYIGKPDWGEQALDLLDLLIGTYKFGIIVVDSVAALVPKKEFDGDMGSSPMGTHARLMSQAMRKITGTLEKSNTVVIFINQFRSSLSAFGSPNVTTGGNALKFYASMRIETTNMGKIRAGGSDDDEGAEVIGNKTRITMTKNKLGPPWRVANMTILYSMGFDNVGGMFELAKKNELDCVKQESALMWTVFGNKVKGRAAALELARQYEAELVEALDAYYTQGVVG